MEIILVCGPVPNGTLDIGLWSLFPGVPFVISDIQDGAQERAFFCAHTGLKFPADYQPTAHMQKCRHTNIWLHMM